MKGKFFRNRKMRIQGNANDSEYQRKFNRQKLQRIAELEAETLARAGVKGEDHVGSGR